MSKEELIVDGDCKFGAEGSDAEQLFFGDIDVDFLAGEFLPGGTIHLADQHGVLAWFDADEVSAMGIVADGWRCCSKENSRTPTLSVVHEIEGDGGGEIIGYVRIEEDFFAAAIGITGISGKGAEGESVFVGTVKLVVAVKGMSAF